MYAYQAFVSLYKINRNKAFVSLYNPNLNANGQ
jgi:hypothetical protein